MALIQKSSLSPRNAGFSSHILAAFVIVAGASTGLPARLSGVALEASAKVVQDGVSAADRMQQKLEAIVRFGAIPRLETQSTVIEEGEVNAYLQHYLRAEIPPGISPPVLRILADNRLSATATFDLDVMNASRPPSEGFDPLRMLTGSLPAKVTGRLVTENGSGRFELESAELGGIPLPRALVSQLVSRYSVSAEEPKGIDLDAPFDLPSSIREDPGRAWPGDRAAVTAADPLQAPLGDLPGVGPTRAAALASAGLRTLEDLLLRFPLRYEDRGHIVRIADLRPGTATVAGEVADAQIKPTRRPRFTVFEVTVRDPTGSARAVFFNQRFLAQVFRPGQQVVLHGKVEWTSLGPQFQSPQYEFVDLTGVEDGDSVHTGRIVPIYERIGPLTPKLQRDLVARALERLPEVIADPLPIEVRHARGLPSRREAMLDTHFPPEGTSVATLNAFRTPSQVRLILEEFVLFQLALADQRARVVTAAKPHRVVVSDDIRALARRALPFTLTPGQKQALREIVEDLQRPTAMNRLLQGDVGAGKTIVALLAAIVAMANGLQVVLMAPTELLAEQHARTVALRLEGTPFRSVLLTGSQRSVVRRDALAAIASGEAQLVVGTHAVLEDPALFNRLGLVIIDEQHRFGVGQRARLRSKGRLPDVLVMTATPIPRTLALTAYGDLDVSVIRDLPPGRQPVRTTARPDERRDDAYAFVREQVAEGRQAYVVLPIIEDSDKIDVRAAVSMEEALRDGALAGLRIGLLHGRMKAAEKQTVMQAFIAHDVDVLVSTTVIEVGVDVPNASVMVVEHAERFGLAQLHQLRGRVGRGAAQSYCVLLFDRPLSEEARERLKAMTDTTDGFVIAERDLAIRGPGDMFGTRQAGLPTLRIGDLARDQDLMADAHEIARGLVEQVPGDALPRRLARAAWSGRFNLAQVG